MTNFSDIGLGHVFCIWINVFPGSWWGLQWPVSVV